MTDQHPITPSIELVRKWAAEYWDNPGQVVTPNEETIAIRAAHWGANQELKACCEWLDEASPIAIPLCGHDLRIYRRPKPRSCKQRALDALAQMEDILTDLTTEIRNALEELPDD